MTPPIHATGLTLLALVGLAGWSACSDESGPPDMGMAGGDLGGPLPPEDDPAAVSVLQKQKNRSRDGHYIDPTLTRAAVRSLRPDPSFDVPISGPVYAQPLYLAGPGGDPHNDLIFVATETNWVYALRAEGGAVAWQQKLGAPVAVKDLDCGNIDPLGVTGTPVIDPVSRTLYLDAMTTPDGGVTIQHLIFALSADDGSTRPGWPVDTNARVRFGGLTFTSSWQNQRGGLVLAGGVVYVPYGGHNGDCDDFHGWVVGVPVDDPTAVRAWATSFRGGGSWAPGGLASDGTAVYASTGNTVLAPEWSGGEAVLRLLPGPVFSGKPADFFSPTDWRDLDRNDLDIGSSGPVLLDVPGATPEHLVVALGKSRKVYLLDRQDLGGISDGLSSAVVATEDITQAAAAYHTVKGTYVAFEAFGAGCPNEATDRLTVLRIVPGAPPRATLAWCADPGGVGSPVVSTTDGHSGAVVWILGSEVDNGLRAFDGDTGELLARAAPPGAMRYIRRFQSPILARGRIFVATDKSLVAFTTH